MGGFFLWVLIPLLTSPIVVVAALIVPASRALAIFVAILGLLPPFWPHAAPLLRALVGISAIAALARVIDMEPGVPALERALRSLTIVDWRRTHRVPRRFDLRRLALAALFGALLVAALFVTYRLRPGPIWRAWPSAAVAMWAAFEAGNALVAFGTELFGVRVDALHEDPLTSRTLAELWGKRWNLTVTRWLNEHIFRPLVRRGHPKLGVLAAFAVSAAFHAYLAGAAGGPICALTMGSFFAVQGVLVIVERALHLRGRVWFFAAILLPAPLFLEPMIAVTRPSASPLGSERAARVDAQAPEAR